MPFTFTADPEPVQEAFTARRGRTWRRPLRFFEDKLKTKPLDLTGWTAQFVVEGYETLTSGSGLVVALSNGLITPELTAAQTQAAPAPTIDCWLDLTGPSGEVITPLEGTITFSDR